MPVKDEFNGYSNPKKMSETERAADFLHWCAKKYPGRYVSLRYIVRAAHILSRLPREESELVKLFAKKMQRVGDVLNLKYGQALVPLRTVGYRATFSQDDLAAVALEAKVRRIVGSRKGFDKIRRLIDLDKIKDPALRERVRQLDKASRTLGDSYIRQIGKLPPPKKNKK